MSEDASQTALQPAGGALPRWVIRDTPAARSLVKKLSEVHKPGTAIPLTAGEWRELNSVVRL